MAQQCWVSITAGPFLAPFFQNELGLTSTQIGILLAVHWAINVVSSSLGGRWADAMEVRYPRQGRAMVMALGATVGGCMMLLNGLSSISGNDFFENDTFFDGGLF